MKKLTIIAIMLLTFSVASYADNPSFIDFKKVLNSSKPGAEAQKNLKEKFQQESKKFNQIEEDIRKEETEIISQKKSLSAEDYQKKVKKLRKKVADLQKNKTNSFNGIAKSRNETKQMLLKSIQPIIKKYMEANTIRIVLDKQSVVLGDTTLEITDQIIAIVNKEVSSLKIN